MLKFNAPGPPMTCIERSPCCCPPVGLLERPRRVGYFHIAASPSSGLFRLRFPYGQAAQPYQPDGLVNFVASQDDVAPRAASHTAGSQRPRTSSAAAARKKREPRVRHCLIRRLCPARGREENYTARFQGAVSEQKTRLTQMSIDMLFLRCSACF